MNGVKKILVFKLCCFGDIVFITPAIKSLRLNFPDAEIVLISSSWIKNLFPLIEDTDRLIVYDPPSDTESFIGKTQSALKLVKMLRREKFDLVFLGHRNNMFGRILRLAGIKYRLGFSETKHMNITAPFRAGVHENSRYLEILSGNNLKTASPVSVLKKEADKNGLKKSQGLEKYKKIIGLFPFGGVNPGTRMTVKRWDLDKFLQLAQKISVTQDTGVVMFEGREADEKFGSGVVIPANCEVRKIDFGVIPVCDVFVSADTGPLHIAAALGVPTVGLFGPSDPGLVAPPDESGIHAYIRKDLPCSPCYTPSTAIDRSNRVYWKGSDFVCRLGTGECMKGISVDDVYGEIKTILNKTK